MFRKVVDTLLRVKMMGSATNVMFKLALHFENARQVAGN